MEKSKVKTNIKPKKKRKPKAQKKILKNFKFEPTWFSFVGALYSVLNYRKEKVALSDLFGWTFSGFRINIEKNIFPYSGNNFPWPEVFPLICDNIGYNFSYVQSIKGQNLFYTKKEEAIELIKSELNQKRPIIVFGLSSPEFGVVYGYDDEKKLLHFVDAKEQEGQIYYKDLGESKSKYLSVLAIKEKLRIDLRKTILYSLTYAVWYSDGFESIEEDSQGGLKAYDLWIEELRRRKFDHFGNSYNAAVVFECRQMIVSYLNSIIPQFKPDLTSHLKKANDRFKKVVLSFNEFIKIFPYPGSVEDTLDEEKILNAILTLRDAEKYEQEAINHIKAFLNKIMNKAR